MEPNYITFWNMRMGEKRKEKERRKERKRKKLKIHDSEEFTIGEMVSA